MKTRRFFLSGLATAAAASFTETLRAAPDPKKDVVIGHGSHRYKVNKEWVPAGQGRHHPILNCHEMVQVKDGRLFMIGDSLGQSDARLQTRRHHPRLLGQRLARWPWPDAFQ